MNNRYEMLNLMRTMANGIVAAEVVADHVAEVAAELDAAGENAAADVLRMLGRNHRVRSMELQGQLAAFSGTYADLGLPRF
ncbi:hypothetical protein, partial [Methylobacterium platani]